jgi:mycothiol synthase
MGEVMTIVQRSYINEADKERMSALARQFPAGNLNVIDLPHRLCSWAFDDPDNVRLWFAENEELVAWAVLQTPFRTIDCGFNPDYEADLYPQILNWADERARTAVGTPSGRPAWFSMVFPGQVDRIHNLEKAGFLCQADAGEHSWSKVLLRRSGSTPVKGYPPPAGFIVRPLAGENEAQAYVDLHRSVFESKNMTVEWRKRILKHPAYKPDLDLVVEAPDGRLAAFCVCWFAESLLAGQVEPMGCLADFRHSGLGRAVLSQGLHRLQSLGAQSIFIGTDNYRGAALRLYESFDFKLFREVLVYRKEYSEI